MWKYVSRRIRDTFERTANHFDKRSAAGLANSQGNSFEEKNTNQPCRRFASQKCWSNFQQDNTNKKKWNFEHINSTWIGTITWSSALVVGYYASQLIHLKHKYHKKHSTCQAFERLKVVLSPFISCASKNALCITSASKIEEIVGTFESTVKLVSNECKNEGEQRASTSSSNSDDELGNVLNSIENRLGLTAIENGQHKDGLSLLRSAANRHHAPAIYNLGLCYELGLGVKVNEKTAMELYRSAAELEHPGALYNLGVYYGQGRGGLHQDTSMASRLLRLAAVQGQKDAIKALESLDLPLEEAQSLDISTDSIWEDSYTVYKDNEVPTLTTLFVNHVKVDSPYVY